MERITSHVLSKENYHREGKPGVLRETKRAPLNNVANQPTQKYADTHKKAEIKKPLKTERQATTVKEIIKKTDSLLIKKEILQPIQNHQPLTKKDNVYTLKKVKTEYSYSSRQLMGILDIDENETDPMLVSEYIKDIMVYLMELESKNAISKHYLTDKHLIKSRMRAVLVNWMAEVTVNFKFIIETFHLSVSILDRYLEMNRSIGKEMLQLVGTTAMLIAAKYEEMYIPDLGDFVYICDNLYTKRQILRMELDILRRLDFNLGKPLSIHFLRRFSRVIKATSEQHNFGKYLTELALFDYNLCHVKPSLLAAAACCVSVSLFNEIEDPAKVWTPTLRCYTTYKFSEIKEVAMELCNALIKIESSKHQAIRSKYSAPAVGKISLNSKLRAPLIRKLALQFSDEKKC